MSLFNFIAYYIQSLSLSLSRSLNVGCIAVPGKQTFCQKPFFKKNKKTSKVDRIHHKKKKS